MALESEGTDAIAVQGKYARLAGFLFLFVIAIAFAAGFIVSRIEARDPSKKQQGELRLRNTSIGRGSRPWSL